MHGRSYDIREYLKVKGKLLSSAFSRYGKLLLMSTDTFSHVLIFEIFDII